MIEISLSVELLTQAIPARFYIAKIRIRAERVNTDPDESNRRYSRLVPNFASYESMDSRALLVSP